jgi:hypothetical protein
MTERILPEHYDLDKEVADIVAFQAWPNFPILPVKKVDGSWECGIVVANDLATVILVNMWSLAAMTAQDLEQCERLTFDSVEALVAAGWIGD